MSQEIPSPNSIENWVEKCGYYICETTGSEDFPEGCATVVNESMTVGSEKLLLTPGVPSEKRGDKSLTESDVRVLDMSVKRNWNSTGIGEVCEKTEEKMQPAPAYTVSDNAGTINKAIRGKGYPRLRDAGHTSGLFLQHVYGKEEDFQRFMKEVSGVKFREIMRPAAYLLPRNSARQRPFHESFRDGSVGPCDVKIICPFNGGRTGNIRFHSTAGIHHK